MPSLDAKFTTPLSPSGPSPRLSKLRETCFFGDDRGFVNALIPIATTAPWDDALEEAGFLAAPEAFDALADLRDAFNKAARQIDIPKEFYRWSLSQRRVWLLKEALLEHTPLEILPGDLLAGARCNLMLSRCLSKAEIKTRSKLLFGKEGLFGALSAFQADGRGCAGLTGGRFAPDYPHLLEVGFSGIQAEIRVQYDLLPKKDREGELGTLLRTRMDACKIPVLLAERYAALCTAQAEAETDPVRKGELTRMAKNLAAVPAGPAQDFYQAIQSLWLAHMALTAEESGAAGSVSFGRIDQYLLPYWQKSVQRGMDRSFGKDLIGCLLLHCGSIRDAMTGYTGPDCAAGTEQLFFLSGLAEGVETVYAGQTNPLTELFLEAFSELCGLSGAAPVVLFHRRSPDPLIRAVFTHLSARTDAPLRIRLLQSAPVDATLPGDDAPPLAPVAPEAEWHTAACAVQLPKAVELALSGGRGFAQAGDPRRKRKRADGLADGPDTGDAAAFDAFETLYGAFQAQLAFLISQAVELSCRAADIRGQFAPMPLVSGLVPGCRESLQDVVSGGAAPSLLSVCGAGFATAVDSLLTVRYLVFEAKVCGMETLIAALSADWYGYELLQAAARYRAPKYGRDDPVADALAARVASDFAALVTALPPAAKDVVCYPHFSKETARPLSFPTPDGRNKGEAASVGLTPSPLRETAAATAFVGSMTAALGDPAKPLYRGCGSVSLPCLDPSDPEAPERLKAFLRGAASGGGKDLLLSFTQDALPAEGEPDYDCCPVYEDNGL